MGKEGIIHTRSVVETLRYLPWTPLTADAIAARVQAFRELKKVVDEKVLREVEAGGAKPANDLFAQVRRLLSL